MSITPAIGSNPSLCSSSSSVPRTCVVGGRPKIPKTQYSPHFPFSPFQNYTTNVSLIHLPKRPASVCRVGDDGVEAEVVEEYEAELDKPYGLKFAKGRDGGTYIDLIASGGSADISGKFEVGDKVIATSAVFGTDIWPAAEYGRTMYTIRQRIGPLLMKMRRGNGVIDDGSEPTEKEIIRAERNSGVISSRVREIQMQNYNRKIEKKQQRVNDLRQGLLLYKSGEYEAALERFESVIGSKPEPNEASVASYNVACCYSKLNQIQAALSALEDAMEAGYEDFKGIRNDPDLASMRASEEFLPLLNKYDESFINENAVNAIKSIFGIFNKN